MVLILQSQWLPTSGWQVTNASSSLPGNDQGSNNSSGFDGYPSGLRPISGNFFNISRAANWWTSTQVDATNALLVGLYYENSVVSQGFGIDKKYGYSIRCIQD